MAGPTSIDINRTTSISLPPAVSGDILQKTQESSAVMRLARRIALPGLSFSHSVILSHKKSIGLPSFREDAARKRHPPWIYGKQTSCLISRTARTAAARG